MCLYSLGMLISDMLNDWKQLVQTLFRLRRKKYNRSISHEQKMIAYFLFKLMHRFVILFNNIPFVHDKNSCLASFIRITCYVLILLYDAFLPINQNKYNIRTLNRFHSAHNAVFFDIFVYLAAFPHTGCINQNVLLTIFFKRSINRIPGRSSDITYNNAFLSQYCIDQ
ncbi:hypothetical protein D3C78_1293270 [compost metagenome]